MKKYKVKFKNKIINKTVIVKASEFKTNSLSGQIFFKDNEGQNVAFFNTFDIEHIRLAEEVEIN